MYLLKALYTVEDMCRRYPNATALSISGPAIYLLVMKAICSLRYVFSVILHSIKLSWTWGWFVVIIFRNLEALTLGRGQIADSFFLALPDCSMLKKLHINDSTLGNGIQEISVIHERLCDLEITKCRVMRIQVRWICFVVWLILAVTVMMR